MNFLSNLEIKNKLLLLVSFPLVALLYFSGNAIYKSYITGKNVENATILTKMAVKISALVHETQKERGMTAGFLGSKGKKFTKRLPAQRLLTNKKLVIFKNNVKKHKSLLNKEAKKYLQQAINQLNKINHISWITWCWKNNIYRFIFNKWTRSWYNNTRYYG